MSEENWSAYDGKQVLLQLVAPLRLAYREPKEGGAMPFTYLDEDKKTDEMPKGTPVAAEMSLVPCFFGSVVGDKIEILYDDPMSRGVKARVRIPKQAVFAITVMETSLIQAPQGKSSLLR